MNSHSVRPAEVVAATAKSQSGDAQTTSNARRPTTIRPCIRRLHLWLGLVVGVYLLVIGLSGSALVFREEWNAALEPVISQRTEMPESREIAAAVSRVLEREFPGFNIRMLVFPSKGRPVRVIVQKRGSRPVQVYRDPVTTAVLARGGETTFPDQVADFHHNLLIGRSGRVINGVIAVVLLLLIASGVWLWATQKRSAALRLTIRWSNRRRGIFDLHTAAGFWLTPFLALMAVSAVYFAWHEQVAAFINTVTFSKAAESVPTAPVKSGQASLEAFAVAAARAMPEGNLSFIQLPEHPGEPVVARVKHREEWRSNGSSQVYLNPSDASVLLRDRTAEQPLGTRIVRNLAPLHFGEFGGLSTRIAWVLLGVTPGMLFVTGFLLWRKKLI